MSTPLQLGGFSARTSVRSQFGGVTLRLASGCGAATGETSIRTMEYSEEGT